MPLTQKAQIRYRCIDRCLHDWSKRYGLIELREACLYDMGKSPDDKGLDKRTIQMDLRDLRDYYGVDIEEVYINRRKYFRYRDPHFSLWCESVNSEEVTALSEILGLMSKFEGNALMPWMEELKLHIEDYRKVEEHDPIICFENNPDLVNLSLLRTLYDMVSHKKVATLYYKRYEYDSPLRYQVSPYYLKQYNCRWYLWARIDSGKTIYSFAIDRITDIMETPDARFVPCDIDFHEYFDDIIGITKYARNKPKKILLAITRQKIPYLLTNPLHPTQVHRRNNVDHYAEKYPDYEFIEINVRYNHELYNTILALGKDCIVLEPSDLRDTIRGLLLDALNGYNI